MAAHRIPPDATLPAVIEVVRPRSRPLLAWGVIVLLAPLAGLLAAYRPVSKTPSATDRATLLVLQLQARYLVGSTDLAGRRDPRLLEQTRMLNAGPVSHRLRYVILTGELGGPEQAVSRLAELDQKLADNNVLLTPTEASLKQALAQLYNDYADGRLDGPSLDSSERELLRSELDWFGKLALAPAGGPNTDDRQAVLRTARWTLFIWTAAMAGVLVLAVPGLAGVVTLGVLLALGRVRSRVDLRFPNGGVYAETFALWMTLFLVLSLLAALVPLPGSRLLLAGLASLLSLSALAWPVLRGVPWRTVRHDIGWHGGRHPALEAVLGLASYAMALPLLGLGALITFVLVVLTKGLPGDGTGKESFVPLDQPTHPVMDVVAGAGVWDMLQLLFLASVAAPVVEETMFRGVLHRHLREATSRWGFVGSFLFSSTVVSFLFAAIHPQGLLLVPVLMALAYGFSLAREWRGSLIPAMVAHGVHNGALLLMLRLALAG